MSNFPNGFSTGVTIRGIPLHQAHPGEVFYVNSSSVLPKGGVGGSDGNDGTYLRPFSTLDYAIGRCTAGRGDVIYLMPGHTETVIAATTIAADVAGVAIVGLGSGSSRPTLTYTTANTATINVSAANVSFKNLLFVGNFLSIASAITVGAAPWCTVEDCEFKDTSAILGFLSAVTTTVTVNADHLHLINNRIHSIATTRTVAPIVILGTMTGLTATKNRVVCSVAHNNVSQFISHAALVMTDLLVTYNTVYCVNTDTATGAVFISTTATTGSGIIAHNRIRALDVAAAIVVTAAAVQYGMFDNLYTGEITQLSGFVLPAIGTDA
ncbi:MAG: hypothetical protein OEY29_14445 [Gammaproteobacteria bacterium]|nr:hypothetical protein [Gammaproteobacteria bacterium]